MKKTQDEIVKKYKQKIKLIRKYDKYYHDKDSPLVSDYKYDEIKREIVELENKYSYLKKLTLSRTKLVIGLQENLKKSNIQSQCYL